MRVMARLAWFSPMPPDPSGPAAVSAFLVNALAARHTIDVFVDEPTAAASRSALPEPRQTVQSAHDFVPRHRQQPYAVIVYQLGNSSAHDFLWPYLFRYPGVAVLHDGHLHHARAAALLRERRIDDYRAEFASAHPDVAADAAELAAAGFDSFVHYQHPMTRLVVAASRLTAVHARTLARRLATEVPGARVEHVRLGHGTPMSVERLARERAQMRARHGLSGAEVVFGVFGGITPEKRVPQVLRAFAALLRFHPSARLLVVGAAAAHYDLWRDVRALDLATHVVVTGHVSDAEFTGCIAACDVCINLRWPTAREVSGPWLQALAAGRPTITMDLHHTADVPALDPRTWTTIHASDNPAVVPEPVTVAIDILDEDHSLRLAMRRLAADEALRTSLGRAAHAYWRTQHSPEVMVEDYERVIAQAIDTPDPDPHLPPHLRSSGEEWLRTLLAPFALAADPWSRI
jgi:glycosyltransferase involved in cell wall biosynthesis